MKKFSLFLMLMVASVVFYACSNSSEDLGINPNSNSSATTETTNVELLVNPYTVIGELHNSGLDAIGSQLNSTTFTFIGAGNIVRQYLATNESEYVISQELSDEIALKVEELKNLTNLVDITDVIYQEGSIDLEVKEGYEQIYNTIQNALNLAEQQGLSNEADVFNLISSHLITLEQSMLTTTYTSNTNRQIILSSVATAIKSTEFWKDATLNINNPYHGEILELKKGKFWKWLGRVATVIGGDAVGAVIGMALGGNGVLGGTVASAAVVAGIVAWKPN